MKFIESEIHSEIVPAEGADDHLDTLWLYWEAPLIRGEEDGGLPRPEKGGGNHDGNHDHVHDEGGGRKEALGGRGGVQRIGLLTMD